MIISYNWLSEYLPETIEPEKLSKILTSIGLEVESLEKKEAVTGGLQGLVIGEVVTCEKHPDADKLSLTTVNIGTGEKLQIVCGAANVAAGQKVVVATIGSTIYPVNGEPLTMKKAKIRGVAVFQHRDDHPAGAGGTAADSAVPRSARARAVPGAADAAVHARQDARHGGGHPRLHQRADRRGPAAGALRICRGHRRALADQDFHAADGHAAGPDARVPRLDSRHALAR